MIPQGAHVERELLQEYVEGRLTDETDGVIEAHLNACEACARIVDGYVGFLGSPPDRPKAELEAELRAAVLRVHGALFPRARRAGQAPDAIELLRSAHGIVELVRADSPRASVLLRGPGKASVRAAAAGTAGRQSSRVEALLQRGGDRPERREARLSASPLGPHAAELLLEVDLDLAGWSAGLVWLNAREAAAVELYRGVVDEEGLIEAEAPVEPGALDPAGLRLGLVEPAP
jgi:hypothetical protein